MAMRDVVGSSSALVDAQLAADLLAMGWPALSSALGSTADWAMTAPPAVVWVPTRDRFDSTRCSFRPPGTAADAMPDVKGTCWMGFEARLWATYTNLPVATRPTTEDFSATEMLRDQLIMALRKVTLGFFTLNDGYWSNLSGAKQGGEELLLGRSYVLNLEIAKPLFGMVAITQKQTLATVPMTSRTIINTTES